MKLIKVNRTFVVDSVEKTVTDLFIELENGYRIAIKPKFEGKRDWRDLYMLAEPAEARKHNG